MNRPRALKRDSTLAKLKAHINLIGQNPLDLPHSKKKVRLPKKSFFIFPFSFPTFSYYHMKQTII